MSKHEKTSSTPPEPDSSPDSPDLPSSPDASPAGLSLADHFLIAMPSMLDPVFGGTVVYLCEHNTSGALGVIINKPTDMTVENLLSRIDLKLEIAPALPSVRDIVLYGGPVQSDRGFVLHAPERKFTSTLPVTDAVSMTTSKDILEAVARGEGPSRVVVSLGCAGWGAGQLEDEITRNGWLTVKADPTILFELPLERRFAAALKLLGIDPLMLSAEAGHA